VTDKNQLVLVVKGVEVDGEKSERARTAGVDDGFVNPDPTIGRAR
jgi:hypothetical protein